MHSEKQKSTASISPLPQVDEIKTPQPQDVAGELLH